MLVVSGIVLLGLLIPANGRAALPSSNGGWGGCDALAPGLAFIGAVPWWLLGGAFAMIACSWLGWWFGQRRGKARVDHLLERVEGQIWEAVVERRDGRLVWSYSTHPSGLCAGQFRRDVGMNAALPWRDVEMPEKDAMEAHARRALEEGLKSYSHEFPIESGGRRLWMQEHVTIRPLGSGRWSLVGLITDITPLHEAQESLRERDRLVVQTLARADCLLWRARVRVEEGKVRWLHFDMPVSALYRRLFGDRPLEMGGKLWSLLEVPDLPKMNERSSRAILSGSSGYEQEFLARRGAEQYWLHEQVSIAPGGQGEFHLVGVIMDLTAVRTAVEARKATEAQIGHLLAHADCLLWQARVIRTEDPELRWTIFVPRSKLHSNLFGFDPGEGAGAPLPWPSIVSAKSSAAMHRRAREAILSGAPSYEQEIHAVRAGHEFWLHERVNIQAIGEGEWFLVGAIFDVTELRRAEAALAAEKERLAVTLAAMSDAVVTTDRAGLVLFANRAAGRLLSLDPAAAVGRPAMDLCRFVDEQGVLVPLALDEAIGRDTVVPLPSRLHVMVEPGRRVSIEGALAPVHDLHGSVVGVVVVVRDVTERERLEQEISRASKLQSIGVLAGGIAHDFNNLLTVIMGNVAVARQALPANGEPAACLQEAERAVVRAKDLTQQLLTFARGGDPVRATVHLADTITEAAAFGTRGSNVRCEFDLAADLWPAEVDRGQIGQVVQNLVLNAVQAMPGGGVVRIAAHNHPVDRSAGTHVAGAYVQITVADTGCGIPEANLARIFDPYFTTKAQGSGLGLATVYSIVRKHRGTIDVASTPGEGTTFRILLPAAPQGTAVPTPSAGAAPPRLRGRILLMDDEEPIRKMAGRMLGRLGLTVETAADGAQAVEMFRAGRAEGRPFDIVMLDLTVPGGMGGLEAFRKIREIDPEVRAVVSSGYSTDMVLGEYRAHGFVGMIAKPYRIDDCARVLSEVLSGAKGKG